MHSDAANMSDETETETQIMKNEIKVYANRKCALLYAQYL